jgi:hypothetical protein
MIIQTINPTTSPTTNLLGFVGRQIAAKHAPAHGYEKKTPNMQAVAAMPQV